MAQLSCASCVSMKAGVGDPRDLCEKPGIVVHTHNLCAGEIEKRGSPELTGQPVSIAESGSSGIDDRPCLEKAR